LGGGIFFFSFFSIYGTRVERLDDDPYLNIVGMAQILEYTKGKNIFLLSDNSLTNIFLDRFPEIAEIEISKEYPSTLVVRAKTFPIVAQWKYYDHGIGTDILGGVNQKGVFFDGEMPDNLFLIEEKAQQEYETKKGNRIISEQSLLEILSTRNEIETLTSLKISSAQYLKDAQEIHFYSEENTSFWFLLGVPLTEQLEKLKIVLLEQGYTVEELKKKAYFDLRIKNSFIIKEK
jgi:hypothetical protein